MADLSGISSGFEITTQEGFSTNLNGDINASASSILVDSLSGYDNGDKIVLTIDRVDDEGNATPSKEQVYYGEVSGSTLINCVSTEGTDQSHADGAVVEDITTSTHYGLRKKLTEQEHNDDGTHSDVTVDSLTGRIVPRVGTAASSATPTINTDNVDMFSITALATDITSMTTNLSGSPSNGEKLIVRIKDDGTGRTISWGASFEAKGVSLPTSTTASKVLTVGFIYDSVTSKWGCVAVAEEA